MEEIKKIKKITLWIFLLPVIALNTCWLIVVNYQLFMGTLLEVDIVSRLGFSIPYITGEFSISRTARIFPTYLIFKPLMILTAFFLIRYWLINNKLLKSFNKSKNLNHYFVFFGVGSAVLLILHSIFLGIKIDFSFYKIFRQSILLGFIIFEIVAQSILIITFVKLKEKIYHLINKNILTLKIILVSLLIVVALLSVPILVSSDFKNLKHALEWNYFIGVVSFYLLTKFFWKTPS